MQTTIAGINAFKNSVGTQIEDLQIEDLQTVKCFNRTPHLLPAAPAPCWLCYQPFKGGGPGVILILLSFVVLVFLFVVVFYSPVSNCHQADDLSLVGPTGVQLLGFCSSSVSEWVCCWALVSSKWWILIYMLAVYIHVRNFYEYMNHSRT